MTITWSIGVHGASTSEGWRVARLKPCSALEMEELGEITEKESQPPAGANPNKSLMKNGSSR